MNLDYITDEVCNSIRYQILTAKSPSSWISNNNNNRKSISSNNNSIGIEGAVQFDARLPLVVDSVLLTLCKADQSQSLKQSVNEGKENEQGEVHLSAMDIKQRKVQQTLLKDLILNIMDAIDAFAATNMISAENVIPLVAIDSNFHFHIPLLAR